MDLARLQALAAHSIAVITAHQAPTGAYLASPAFPVYRYSWLRDGAFIADAHEPRRRGRVRGRASSRWCDRRRAGAPRPHRGPHRARTRRGEADRPTRTSCPPASPSTASDGAEEWTDSSSTATAPGCGRSSRTRDATAGPSTPSLDGAAPVRPRTSTTFRDHPSYDWWEEHADRRHVSTLASIHGGPARWPAGRRLDPASARRRAAVADRIARLRHAMRRRRGPRAQVARVPGGGRQPARRSRRPSGCWPPDDPLMVRDGRGDRAPSSSTTAASTATPRTRTSAAASGCCSPACSAGTTRARAGATDALRQLAWIGGPGDGRRATCRSRSAATSWPRPASTSGVERWGPVATPLLWSHGDVPDPRRRAGVCCAAARRRDDPPPTHSGAGHAYRPSSTSGSRPSRRRRADRAAGHDAAGGGGRRSLELEIDGVRCRGSPWSPFDGPARMPRA